MRRDHRPYRLKRWMADFERLWSERFVRPQTDAMGRFGMIMKPWYLKLYGKGICLGDEVHIVTARDRTVRLTTWPNGDTHGRIEIGDYALLCPGVRIDSAAHITVGDNTMLAAGVYVTDADWHDLYDRSAPIGRHAAVEIGNNAWIGDGATVCKGVSIGENTIIGANAVVTRDIPANAIAAGNPAEVIRELDPSTPLRTRSDLLSEPGLNTKLGNIEREMLAGNSWLGWLRASLKPGAED